MTLKPNPFETLPPDEYFVRREGDKNIKFEQNYWGPTIDPDGNERNLLEERDRKLVDLAQELAFINAREPGRILDIGCGPGFLLSGVNEGWACHGVELSSFIAEHAQQWGDIFVGLLDDAGYADGMFDVITAYQVFEHIDDPVSVMAEIRRVLKDDGALVINVPNFDGACARRYGERYRMLNDPTHVALYSPDSMRRLMRDCGFVVENIEFPYFDTEYFTEENLKRLFDTDGVSPPFYGNVMSVYARKMSPAEARAILDSAASMLEPFADGDD